LSAQNAVQPWDRAGWKSPAITPLLDQRRAAADPHNPAISAILDCVEFGLPQSFEGAIRSEMAIFSALIQRPEPRNMIQTLFLGKTDYERAARKEALPAAIPGIVATAQAVSGDKVDAAALHAISAAVAPLGASLSFEEKRMADYACVVQAGFPAFLGGPFTFAARGFD
jgi:3-hydroxyacyl-CoA dehydrogenase/enoyl-CoA hydratase/3-hydroxybutyryl-CoA epimerase